MQVHDSKRSHILISTEIEAEFERLKEVLKPFRVVGFIEEDFKVENAKAVIAEAYVSESHLKYIILGAKSYNSVSQNALLKVLEEPPRNIEFIIISPTKSNLLPTVRSRLPIFQGEQKKEFLNIELNLTRIDYAQIFAFLKENNRVKKSDAKLLIEALYRRATLVDKLILSRVQLDNFEKAYRLLELNSRPQSVLAMVIMSFVKER